MRWAIRCSQKALGVTSLVKKGSSVEYHATLTAGRIALLECRLAVLRGQSSDNSATFKLVRLIPKMCLGEKLDESYDKGWADGIAHMKSTPKKLLMEDILKLERDLAEARLDRDTTFNAQGVERQIEERAKLHREVIEKCCRHFVEAEYVSNFMATYDFFLYTAIVRKGS